MIQQWEYKKVLHELTFPVGEERDVVDELGDQGWELVTVMTHLGGNVWVFKRPKVVKGPIRG